MLKRNIGRSLLALLVVTGLAGTVDTNSLFHAERKSALVLLKNSRSDLLSVIKGLSQKQINYKVAKNEPAIKDYVFLAAAAEKTTWGLMRKAMKQAPNPEKKNLISVSDELLAHQQLPDEMLNGVRQEKINFKSYGLAVDNFIANRTAHIRYMKSTTEDLRNHVVQLPCCTMDCYQLCLLTAAETNYYRDKIAGIKSDKNFPK